MAALTSARPASAPPIVHRTGGLADTVVDESAVPGAGTGFVFDDATHEALLAACAAAATLRTHATEWAGLQDRGMAVDFDWTTGSAPRYVAAYRRAIEVKRA